MIAYQKILELIYSAIDELNAGNGDVSVTKEESTPLFGAASVLDSVDLVNLLQLFLSAMHPLSLQLISCA